MNGEKLQLGLLHLACAVFLLIAKILEASTNTSRVAKILNQGTIFIYIFVFIKSYQISRENFPFSVSTDNKKKIWWDDNSPPDYQIECFSDESGEIQYFLTSEVVAFGANVLVLVFMNMNFRLFNDWKVDFIMNAMQLEMVDEHLKKEGNETKTILVDDDDPAEMKNLKEKINAKKSASQPEAEDTKEDSTDPE